MLRSAIAVSKALIWFLILAPRSGKTDILTFLTIACAIRYN